ncbi:MAG TPA: RNA-binding protein [Dehalococcoidia bacterium]|nr:RNA-binding protein [Dehalococcoidia bacterium]
MSRLYLGNLAHDTTEADLRAAFSPFGEVVSIKVMSDRRGRPKGFGHVEMRDETAARTAMESLRGTQIHGRTMDIVPEEASARRRGGMAYGRSGGRRRR